MKLTRRFTETLFLLLPLLSTCSAFIEERVCIGTADRMSVVENREHHYRNLRDRYTNCTYVDGNLELTWLENKTLDLSFLQYIREVTGYVLISHVSVERIVLPRLQIIRGRTLFKLPVRDEEFSLLVTISDIEKLELPALRDILSGSVGVLNNYNLCHVKTIQWDEIITGPGGQYIYVYNYTHPERKCSCDASCKQGCWGDGADNCQKFSKLTCSPQCYQGRCFGPAPRDCCHLFCAGGCTGPKQSDCLACKNFNDNGTCKQECPPMQKYNTITYSWESNPDGKYAYGATCVKDCPDHLLKDNGACVRSCPPGKNAARGECVPCDGPCPKVCQGGMVHGSNLHTFRDCTIVEGYLQILDQTFTGFQDFYPNYTLSVKHPKIDPSELEVFSTLREVTEYLNVQGSDPNFTDLHYFRNLETIGGRRLTEYFSSLYIVKTSLKSLGLRSLKTIRAGGVVILENKKLCFAEDINWEKLTRVFPPPRQLLQNNGRKDDCVAEKLVCHKECSKEGCWGPGVDECLSCERFSLEDTCMDSCSYPGIYRSGNRTCEKCHEQCNGTCTGPGPGNCTRCMHVKDGPYCIASCPAMKYSMYSECLPCNEKCAVGCTGPGHFVGPLGCDTCDKAIASSDNPNQITQCLKVNEPCEEGYFSELVSVTEKAEGLKSMAGKLICRRCHPRCKNCTGYGFHLSVCNECAQFQSEEQCEDRCPTEYYVHQATKRCIRCSPECKGCWGPGSEQCESCRNLKVPLGDNITHEFNCSDKCPEDKPHRVFEDQDGPYCSSFDPNMLRSVEEKDTRVSAIVGGVLGCTSLIGIFLALFGYQWRQRAKSKENTVKMTMRMSGLEDSEPLKPSNVKPNLAQLRIVKEAELRRGGILGYGAFGTVYKGVWVPEGDNVKIPVAIKVLREGTGTNTNKEILEEAYIMASVEHPHLLKLLAVCMTSQMMLVTQLMPLGCLVDYVRNNKDKIGSKPLLNWCTQIAKGMAHLEEKRLVHRDLAARNVLVQTPGCVKITDFGLAKLLDINEEEYKAAGGKMPIKWLALECIQHRRFTHKSDVWAFGVTVWELLTYGSRPYEHTPARDVPDLLEKGERLTQPGICTIDVYMIMIKCWMLDAESRPSFKELAEEFAKMARDPGRYLVIHGDKLMRLPTYTPQDEKELIRTLSVTTEGTEVIMDAEEYLQPKSNHVVSTGGPPLTPIKKTDVGVDCNGTRDVASRPAQPWPAMTDRSRYAHLEAAGGNSPGRQRENSVSTRYISDPVFTTGKYMDQDVFMNGTKPYPAPRKNGMKMADFPFGNGKLPVDEEDYLMPSPLPHQNASVYMDLIGDSRQGDDVEVARKDTEPVFVPALAVDNPEYHAMNGGSKPMPQAQAQSNCQVPGPVQGANKPRKNTSSEEESDHEYYNDFDRLRRELQPLNHRRSETTV